jgi:hypothetical protein
MHAIFLGTTGRIEEALREVEEANRADPLSGYVSVILQQLLDAAGRPADAQAEYDRTADFLFSTRHVPEHMRLLRVWETGDKAAIKAQIQRFLDNTSLPIPALREVFEAMDEPERARALLRQAAADPANQSTRQITLAFHAAQFGADELAIDLLRRPGAGLSFHLWFPCLRRARRLDGFKQLIRERGLYDFWRQSGKWGDFARPVGSDDFEIIR